MNDPVSQVIASPVDGDYSCGSTLPSDLSAVVPNRMPFHRAARFDGIVPYCPALLGEGKGPPA